MRIELWCSGHGVYPPEKINGSPCLYVVSDKDWKGGEKDLRRLLDEAFFQLTEGDAGTDELVLVSWKDAGKRAKRAS